MPSHKDNKKYIIIKNAKTNNLKNIDIEIQRNKFIVITGLSGSGKSSLAFDTLYAEGQRRYVESLSAYARQFLGRINKPDVEYIKGIPPAIAIEQKVNSKNSRSTVGTSTEIYDYLKLLFAKIGKTYSPVSNSIVKKHSISDVVDYIFSHKKGEKFIVLIPVKTDNFENKDRLFEILLKQGFSKIEINNKIINIETINDSDIKQIKDELHVVIDRLTVNDRKDNKERIADSLQIAFNEGKGECYVKFIDKEKKMFSNRFEADGIIFEEPTLHMFSFNNPLGACKNCEGFGNSIGIDPDIVIPNKNLSVYEDAIVCWRGEKMSKWKQKLILAADNFDFPIHKPICELTQLQQNLLWTGNKYFKGINAFFKYVKKKAYKIQYRVMLSRYTGKTVCPECNGTRLKKETSYVKINNTSIQELVELPIDRLAVFFKEIQLSETDMIIAKRILDEIKNRLEFLKNVGLEYLTLNRLSSTLSGGESQRINLATSIGSSLVGSLYILDEPSIGLHPRDTGLLIKVLKELKKIGNTVIVVEHDEEIIRASDEIIDIGPGAGILGGEIVFQGELESMFEKNNSLTAQYLTGEKKISIPKIRRNWKNYIEVIGALENNLNNINVKFPLNVITAVTGVSGSGKTSLVNNILYRGLKKMIGSYTLKTGKHKTIDGNIQLIADIELIDQNPIGRSSKSNPVTYIKAYDDIRMLFSTQAIAKYSGYKPSHFSFNVDGGRCDECHGEGVIKIEMQFMADVYLTCESCKGKRFKDEVLDVKYNDKNIYDILDMTINQAIEFFSIDDNTYAKRITEKLRSLYDVGLGYIKLGQSSSTLSGGESQRVKLASFLSKEKKQPTLFIFDEPTTGLHFHDINKLLNSINALIEKGHTAIIIEHNLEVIKSADWIIDLGPDGGEKGGNVIFEGTPEQIIKCKKSYTGKFLFDKIKN